MLFLLATTAAGCRSAAGPDGPRIVQPGAPGTASRVISEGPAREVKVNDADVRFMQGMIGHHAQALEMTALLPTRSTHAGMKLLALRISVSQADEITLMQSWLKDRGQEAPGEHAHHAPGAPLMPGMLSPDEMARLAGATGTAFDRLFLELMIRHHEGALVMVKQLFASPGAGQDADIFAFAADVEADQQMEIQRMSGMLRELPR